MRAIRIEAESLAGRVVRHLQDNATEQLHADEIGKLFDVSPRIVHTQLSELVQHQALRRDSYFEAGYVYRRGPQFKMVMLEGEVAPVQASNATAAAAPATSTPTAPTKVPGVYTPTTVEIRKGIPLPKLTRYKPPAKDWGVLLKRLEVGDSTEELPRRMRTSLVKHISEAHKAKDGPRFTLRTTDDKHIAIWRTA